MLGNISLHLIKLLCAIIIGFVVVVIVTQIIVLKQVTKYYFLFRLKIAQYFLFNIIINTII